ncbi:MAG TPA: DUF1634 domain-containing protein [Dissulfurispiraceae bacterium]
MAPKKKILSDETVELAVSYFLRTGVLLAAALVFTGGVLFLMKYRGDIPNYKVFSGEPADLRSVSGILEDSLTFHSRGVIQLGLLVLMLTPVAWIGFLCIAFILQKDRLYSIVALFVLTVLLLSFTGVLGPR